METVILKEDQNTRYVASLDEGGAPMPDGDYYVPQVNILSGTTLNMDADLAEEIAEAYTRLGSEAFARWAYIFHGVRTYYGEYSSHRIVMVAWASPEWVAEMGVDPEYTPDEEDVMDFVNWARGDVYYVDREVSTTYVNEDDPEDKIIVWERDPDYYNCGLRYTDDPEKITDYED